jgi:hypothetical protein
MSAILAWIYDALDGIGGAPDGISGCVLHRTESVVVVCAGRNRWLWLAPDGIGGCGFAGGIGEVAFGRNWWLWLLYDGICGCGFSRMESVAVLANVAFAMRNQ